MANKKTVQTDKAPQAIGPYSQAVVTQGLVYCSGQIALRPEDGQLVKGGVEEQAVLVLNNLAAVLEAANSSMDDLVKVTIFLADMDDFAAVNSIYAERVSEPFPARACVEVSRLPKSVLVEIDAVALVREES